MNFFNLASMGNNPFSLIQQLQPQQRPQQFQQFQQAQTQTSPPINLEQMKTMLPQINNTMLLQLVQQAKLQGISETDIEQGINFLKQL